MTDKSTQKEEITSFTVDSDKTGEADVPSVTRLLNRKKLNISTSSEKTQSKLRIVRPPAASPPPPPPPVAATEADSQRTTILAPQEPPKIQPSRRGSRSSRPSELLHWERATLREGNDPLGKGIDALLQNGATAALFLSIVAPTPENPTPRFSATARVGAPDRAGLWTGLNWNPALTPELWNHFLKTGWVELTPPSTMTNLESARNVVRGAFGVSKDEFLLLVRAGTADACRGLVVFLSKKSVAQEMQRLFSFFSKVPSNQAA